MSHRAPWECAFPKEGRSRCLPGKKPRTDREYFEVLSLCILQAGLSWASGAQELATLPQRVPRLRGCQARTCSSCNAPPQAWRAEEPEEGRGPCCERAGVRAHPRRARHVRAVSSCRQIGKGCVHNSTGTLQACGPVHRGVLPSLRGAVRICSLNVAAKQEDAADRRVPAFEPGMRASRPPAADPQR